MTTAARVLAATGLAVVAGCAATCSRTIRVVGHGDSRWRDGLAGTHVLQPIDDDGSRPEQVRASQHAGRLFPAPAHQSVFDAVIATQRQYNCFGQIRTDGPVSINTLSRSSPPTKRTRAKRPGVYDRPGPFAKAHARARIVPVVASTWLSSEYPVASVADSTSHRRARKKTPADRPPDARRASAFANRIRLLRQRQSTS